MLAALAEKDSDAAEQQRDRSGRVAALNRRIAANHLRFVCGLPVGPGTSSCARNWQSFGSKD